MSRPRDPSPSPAAKRKRFERACHKLGLVRVPVYVHRANLQKLADRSGTMEPNNTKQASQALSQLLEECFDMLAHDLVE